MKGVKGGRWLSRNGGKEVTWFFTPSQPGLCRSGRGGGGGGVRRRKVLGVKPEGVGGEGGGGWAGVEELTGTEK